MVGYRKWPDKIFPIANSFFPMMVTLVLGGGGRSRGGGDPLKRKERTAHLKRELTRQGGTCGNGGKMGSGVGTKRRLSLPSWVYPVEVLHPFLGSKGEQHILASSSSSSSSK